MCYFVVFAYSYMLLFEGLYREEYSSEIYRTISRYVYFANLGSAHFMIEWPILSFCLAPAFQRLPQSERVSQGLNGDLYFSNVLPEDTREDYICYARFNHTQTIQQKQPISLKVVSGKSLASWICLSMMCTNMCKIITIRYYWLKETEDPLIRKLPVHSDLSVGICAVKGIHAYPKYYVLHTMFYMLCCLHICFPDNFLNLLGVLHICMCFMPHDAFNWQSCSFSCMFT